MVEARGRLEKVKPKEEGVLAYTVEWPVGRRNGTIVLRRDLFQHGFFGRSTELATSR
jgi:hypothetical protein